MRNKDCSDFYYRTGLNIELEKLAVELNLTGKRILEIGIAGDEKPSGSHKFFGKGNYWATLDKNPKWKPDIISDICNSKLPDNSFDLIIMTETLEHIWDYKKALSEIGRISKQYAIIDCPFQYSFHCDIIRGDNRHWSEWDDYWRFTPAAFNKILKEAGAKEVKIRFNNLFTIALCEY